RRARRLVLINIALFLSRQAGGLAFYFVVHTTSSAPVMKWTCAGRAGPMVQTGAARRRSPSVLCIENCERELAHSQA
ncbi:hypothetical protein, partial [Pseudomonas syringae group genomosp. 3]